MKHTEARGVDSFDKHYGVGYKVGHDNFSPYGRINSLRKKFLNTEFYIDSQRALLVTESYKNSEHEPAVVRTALATDALLRNVDIVIDKDELIAGQAGAPFKAAPIYPEFSYRWIMDEMETAPFDNREFDEYFLDARTAKELRSIAGYWAGKSIDEEVEGSLSWEDKKGSNMGRGLYLLNLYQYGGIGHYCADYGTLLKIGFGGIRKHIEEMAAKVDPSAPDAKQKADFYRAQIISVDAATAYINRYGDLAANMAKTEKDEHRKTELQQLADVCHQVAAGPARNMWEALQLTHISFEMLLAESNAHSISFGRADQWLYPYYQSDMEKGVDKDFVQELIEAWYIKMGSNSKLRDKMTSAANTGRGWAGESLTVGGVDRDGNDATNDLTMMLIDASIHTRMITPWLCVRVHENTPWELKVKYTEAIRAGYGHPKLYNDQAAIPSQVEHKGRTLEEARDYAIVGCVEIDTPGKEMGWHDAAYINIAKIFELATNGGRCIGCGESCPMYPICGGAGTHLGPDYGSLATFKSVDELLEAFDKQMEYWCDRTYAGIEAMEHAHAKLKPTPYASSLYPCCIDNGKDMVHGGCTYNHTGPQACGVATVADGISAIKYLLFDQKKITGEEFLKVLNQNWEGYDNLYALVNSEKVPHYGNDIDEVDGFAKYAFDCFCKHIENRINARGGTYTPGVYTVSANVSLGSIQAASPDGRKAGEPISDNMGPAHTLAASHDVVGPTAMLNSVNKIDHTRATNGTLLNWKVSPECMSGETGRDNMISMIDAYFAGRPMHVQINVMSSEMMKAALENPKDYKDMLVRVAGYSAYFVELSRPLQLDLISRTEMSFE